MRFTLKKSQFKVIKKIERESAEADLYIIKLLGCPGEKFALKAFKNEQSFKSESSVIDLLSKNPHPYIINSAVISNKIDLDGKKNCVIMEYIEKGDLITNQSTLDEKQSWNAYYQIMTAIEHLHSLGLYHGDLNPGNILKKDDNHFVLIDFGRCKPIKNRMTLEGAAFWFPKKYYSDKEKDKLQKAMDVIGNMIPIMDQEDPFKIESFMGSLLLYYMLTGIIHPPRLKDGSLNMKKIKASVKDLPSKDLINFVFEKTLQDFNESVPVEGMVAFMEENIRRKKPVLKIPEEAHAFLPKILMLYAAEPTNTDLLDYLDKTNLRVFKKSIKLHFLKGE